MKRISEVIASTIVKQCSENPQEAFDAILKLVKDNKALLLSTQQLLSEFAIATKDGRTPNQNLIYDNAVSTIQKAKGEL